MKKNFRFVVIVLAIGVILGGVNAVPGQLGGYRPAPKDNEEVVAAADTLQGHSTSNVASISQKAALQALTGSQEPVTAMLDEYRTRRDQLMAWFVADPRIEVVKPAGAFYLFPRITKVLESIGIDNTGDFAQALLDEARVAVTPGEGFDAPGFLRISYATSLDRLREGTTRIFEFVKKRERQGAVAR